MDTELYKMGWLLVTFDLPTLTKKERKAAHDFREWLKDDGYSMLQWSVYVRPCVTFARQETHLDRLKCHLPPEGSVRAVFVTRSQWERSFVMHGQPTKEGEEPEELPEQILLW
ncbi:MAG: CRISPR-associated endonuclease Cas2 [Prosthecobacter sp.]|uniref:CRISPR-associated endonuclease Cas2 n=1 Tax=Prosthecobacter sp. TaxID=1965333 RepID=UPI00261C2861|nr:CRISPR-associated endonuclease Cas2 [Prosthecobacter sp.]MCF7789996.1 CRISPR-associated endonuclease Cas2 [Prosthecobacter sp.]